MGIWEFHLIQDNNINVSFKTDSHISVLSADKAKVTYRKDNNNFACTYLQAAREHLPRSRNWNTLCMVYFTFDAWSSKRRTSI